MGHFHGRDETLSCSPAALGEGCSGVQGLERVRDAGYVWERVRSAALVGRNGEIHRDPGLSLDRFSTSEVGFEVPLLHGFAGCGGQNGGTG